MPLPQRRRPRTRIARSTLLACAAGVILFAWFCLSAAAGVVLSWYWPVLRAR